MSQIDSRLGPGKIVEPDNGGLRYNEGKRKWGLLSWPALGELVKVLEYGATKYAAFNWARGLSWVETYESLQRHLVSWMQGEDKDPETGLSHMGHVLCNAMFLAHFAVTGTGKDDRPRLPQGGGDTWASKETLAAMAREKELMVWKKLYADQAQKISPQEALRGALSDISYTNEPTQGD